jgi:RNA polymerase sigma factor (TIGR02999 family)
MDQLQPQEQPTDNEDAGKRLNSVFLQFEAVLRKAASRTLQQYQGAASLETGDVINDAWLRLASVDPERLAEYRSLERVAMRTVRNVVLDHLRRRRTRQSHARSVSMGPDGMQPEAQGPMQRRLEDVTEAIEAIAVYAPRVAKVLSLRLLGRLSFDAIAQRLSASERTIEGDWAFGRALLTRRLGTT